jgi:hypothetical protein
VARAHARLRERAQERHERRERLAALARLGVRGPLAQGLGEPAHLQLQQRGRVGDLRQARGHVGPERGAVRGDGARDGRVEGVQPVERGRLGLGARQGRVAGGGQAKEALARGERVGAAPLGLERRLEAAEARARLVRREPGHGRA